MDLKELSTIIKQFEYYKLLGEKTFAQLEDASLYWSYQAGSNSIAVIVNHLYGNMRSRWTDFLTSDGEKEWRNRDQEFEDSIRTREELLEKWHIGWDCLFTALQSINLENNDTKIYIRNQEHTIAEAVHRQMMHYAYHIGQIVFIGTLIKGEAWQSLSIPKNQSTHFNNNKFSQGKHQGHFTDDIT